MNKIFRNKNNNNFYYIKELQWTNKAIKLNSQNISSKIEPISYQKEKLWNNRFTYSKIPKYDAAKDKNVINPNLLKIPIKNCYYNAMKYNTIMNNISSSKKGKRNKIPNSFHKTVDKSYLNCSPKNSPNLRILNNNFSYQNLLINNNNRAFTIEFEDNDNNNKSNQNNSDKLIKLWNDLCVLEPYRELFNIILNQLNEQRKNDIYQRELNELSVLKNNIKILSTNVYYRLKTLEELNNLNDKLGLILKSKQTTSNEVVLKNISKKIENLREYTINLCFAMKKVKENINAGHPWGKFDIDLISEKYKFDKNYLIKMKEEMCVLREGYAKYFFNIGDDNTPFLLNASEPPNKSNKNIDPFMHIIPLSNESKENINQCIYIIYQDLIGYQNNIISQKNFRKISPLKKYKYTEKEIKLFKTQNDNFNNNKSSMSNNLWLVNKEISPARTFNPERIQSNNYTNENKRILSGGESLGNNEFNKFYNSNDNFNFQKKEINLENIRKNEIECKEDNKKNNNCQNDKEEINNENYKLDEYEKELNENNIIKDEEFQENKYINGEALKEKNINKNNFNKKDNTKKNNNIINKKFENIINKKSKDENEDNCKDDIDKKENNENNKGNCKNNEKYEENEIFKKDNIDENKIINKIMIESEKENNNININNNKSKNEEKCNNCINENKKGDDNPENNNIRNENSINKNIDINTENIKQNKYIENLNEDYNKNQSKKDNEEKLNKIKENNYNEKDSIDNIDDLENKDIINAEKKGESRIIKKDNKNDSKLSKKGKNEISQFLKSKQLKVKTYTEDINNFSKDFYDCYYQLIPFQIKQMFKTQNNILPNLLKGISPYLIILYENFPGEQNNWLSLRNNIFGICTFNYEYKKGKLKIIINHISTSIEFSKEKKKFYLNDIKHIFDLLLKYIKKEFYFDEIIIEYDNKKKNEDILNIFLNDFNFSNFTETDNEDNEEEDNTEHKTIKEEQEQENKLIYANDSMKNKINDIVRQSALSYLGKNIFNIFNSMLITNNYNYTPSLLPQTSRSYHNTLNNKKINRSSYNYNEINIQKNFDENLINIFSMNYLLEVKEESNIKVLYNKKTNLVKLIEAFQNNKIKKDEIPLTIAQNIYDILSCVINKTIINNCFNNSHFFNNYNMNNPSSFFEKNSGIFYNFIKPEKIYIFQNEKYRIKFYQIINNNFSLFFCNTNDEILNYLNKDNIYIQINEIYKEAINNNEKEVLKDKIIWIPCFEIYNHFKCLSSNGAGTIHEYVKISNKKIKKIILEQFRINNNENSQVKVEPDKSRDILFDDDFIFGIINNARIFNDENKNNKEKILNNDNKGNKYGDKCPSIVFLSYIYKNNFIRKNDKESSS